MLWVFAALACRLRDGEPPAGDAPVGWGDDADRDGYHASVDCDDHNRRVHPGAEEICVNGRDDNCNGTADGCDWSGDHVLEGTELWASEKYAGLGSTLAICDANGDGVDDVVTSAPGSYAGTGAVYVFHGPITEDREARDADYVLMGTTTGLWTGFSVDCRRDVDGDGLTDILVGAPTWDPPGHVGRAVYVVPGGGIGRAAIEGEASCAWTDSDSGDRLGYNLVAIAADDDETDELAAALGPNAPGTNHFGAVYVFDDAPPGVHDEADATAYIYGDQAGRIDFVVGNAGDLDGDGLEELVVSGTDYDVEELLVFGAPFVGPIAKADADVRIGGGMPGDVWTGIGHADLDNDGRDDLFFANPGADHANGQVYAFFSPIGSDTGVRAADMRIVGPDEMNSAGADVTSPGDVDGDGTVDLLIGGWRGAVVYLQYGDGRGVYDLAKDAQASWHSEERGTGAGTAVAAGDITDDGIGAFVFGAPNDLNGGSITIVPSWQL